MKKKVRFHIQYDSINIYQQAQGQNSGSPFPAPNCPSWGKTKPGQCNLQMASTCDCNPNDVRCGHDGECPGSKFSAFLKIYVILFIHSKNPSGKKKVLDKVLILFKKNPPLLQRFDTFSCRVNVNVLHD